MLIKRDIYIVILLWSAIIVFLNLGELIKIKESVSSQLKQKPHSEVVVNEAFVKLYECVKHCVWILEREKKFGASLGLSANFIESWGLSFPGSESL